MKIFEHDMTLEEVTRQLEKTRRLQGVYQNHTWEVIVGKPCGDGVYQILGQGAWRRSPQKMGLFCCWQTDALLDDFLLKKKANADNVKFNLAEYEKRNPSTKKENSGLYNEQVKKIEMQVPNSPLELSHSALFCFELDLKQIEYHVQLEHDMFMFRSGNLPIKPVIIGVWHSLWRSELQPVLRITFKQYHTKPEK